VGTGDLAHRHDVVARILGRHRTRVVGDVIRAGHDVHDLRLERDDVGMHSHEQLRRCLRADAAPDVSARQELRIGARPPFRDRIAKEYRAHLRARG
jgi:hypothetical protein